MRVMAILMEKEISIDRIIAINNDESYALARPTRGKIVELLNKKQLENIGFVYQSIGS